MREYEVMWVIAPTETDEAVEALVKQYQELLTTGGAEIVKTEIWGRRKLAYPIEKFKEGIYVLFELRAEAAPLDEMVRRFRMTDSVIRFITVRLDLEMRRARKRQAEMKERRGPEAELEAVAGTGEEAVVEPEAAGEAVEPEQAKASDEDGGDA